ncbi:carboxylesterase/lipase family protein [Mangrovicoccus sp. HB161399]|uniref:carboxylesterase/lipase family protein n=1 Tax=Mangrovicoccus sp. HB161399 TaxID=2720392 RepID=UPI001552D3FC|nr:carboxylesterase family protein [Mangrovicoccus sp. HB161399]
MTMISRLAAGSALALALPLAAQAQDAPFTAKTGAAEAAVAQGRLQGFVDRGIETFRGVPYASAARFMPPAPPASWDGTRLAVNYGESCPIPRMAEVANDEQFNPHRYMPENEACQFLNIWTPATGDGGKRPVMVWLHGGGFTNGSSIEQVSYDGRNLAEKGDVVVVSLNHRLNVLGTLDLTQHGERYAQSANTGMKDIVAALEWVQANIAEFGGDPSNVTIFGQSGGGSKVRILMGTPSAEGLFAKAIVQSGASLQPVISEEGSQAIAAHTLENLGLTDETVGEIETVPYDVLLAAAGKALDQAAEEGAIPAASFRPALDGDFMPYEPVDEGWARHAMDVPMMIGNVLNEFETIIRIDPAELVADNKADWTPEKTAAKMKERFGDDAEAISAAWSEAYPEFTPQDAYFFDTSRRHGVIHHAKLKSALGGAPVYSWVMSWQSPVLDGVGGAWHCAEIPMVFDNADLVPQSNGGGADALAMADVMSQAWINFARTGDPNHDDMPDWPAYTAENGATMIFDNVSEVRNHHDEEIMDILYGASGG